MGRYSYLALTPPKALTEDLVQIIARDLYRGVSLRSITLRELIEPAMMDQWRTRGEAYLLNECTPSEDATYGALVLAIKHALGRRDTRIERQISRAGNPNFRQFMAIAERLIPNVWAKDPLGGSDEAFNPDDRFL